MKLLKVIVISLGILIVFGLCLLGYGLIQKTKNPGWQMFSSSQKETKLSTTKTFPTFDLNLPKDCKIIEVSPQREKVFIIIDGASICDRVIVVDTRLGIIVGTIMARP